MEKQRSWLKKVTMMNKKRFVYLMQFNEKRTLQYLSGLKLRIVERKFFRATRERGKHRYWGWVAFIEPIELFDVMEAGLVPTFRMKVEVKP